MMRIGYYDKKTIVVVLFSWPLSVSHKRTHKRTNQEMAQEREREKQKSICACQLDSTLQNNRGSRIHPILSCWCIPIRVENVSRQKPPPPPLSTIALQPPIKEYGQCGNEHTETTTRREVATKTIAHGPAGAFRITASHD